MTYLVYASRSNLNTRNNVKCLFLYFNLLFSVIYSQFSYAEMPFQKFHQCNKVMTYNIKIAGFQTGKLTRNIVWEGNRATVSTVSKVVILGIHSNYTQHTSMLWSPQNAHFLTELFSQKMTGIRNRTLEVNFSNNGTESLVSLGQEISRYSAEQPLLDLDTVGAQLRLNIINKVQTPFTLIRQASNEMESYQFEIEGEKTITLPKWGSIKTIKVNEIGHFKGTQLWFSADHDYQLVKAKFNGWISPTVYLDNISIKCDKYNVN